MPLQNQAVNSANEITTVTPVHTSFVMCVVMSMPCVLHLKMFAPHDTSLTTVKNFKLG